MKTIPIPTSPSRQADARDAICRVVEHIGDNGFVQALLDFYRAAAGASDCSVFVHRGGAPIRIGTARLAGLRAHDVGDCYVRDGYYRLDPVAAMALKAPDRLMLNCLTRDELPHGQWVEDYIRIDLQERISVIVALETGWGIVNAYRPSNCGVSLDNALEQIGRQGSMIASAMRRHVALSADRSAAAASRRGSPAVTTSAPLAGGASPAAASEGDPFGALSMRERQVVESILSGLSAKQSGRMMGLSPTSIATYRRRAFEKLGINRQIELVHLRRH